MAIEAFKRYLRALFGPAVDATHPDAKLAADEAYRATHVVNLMTSANAATNTDAQYFGVGAEDNPRRLLHALFWPDAALDLSSDNGTNNAVFTCKKTDGAGGSATVLANVCTSGSATNLVVGVPYPLTVQCSTIGAGDVCCALIGKNGTGQAITTGRFELRTEAI